MTEPETSPEQTGAAPATDADGAGGTGDLADPTEHLVVRGEPTTGAVAAEAAVDVEEEHDPTLAEVGLNIGVFAAEVEWGEHAEELDRWRQGHILDNLPIVWIAPAGMDPMTGIDLASDAVTPVYLDEGAPGVICSGTCDLGGLPPGSHHPFIEVAPLVHGDLLDRAIRKLASEWQIGYLVPVNSPFPAKVEQVHEEPEDGMRRRKDPPHEWFADLRLKVPASKALLLGRDPIEGFADEVGYENFAEALGYKARRPALHAALSENIPDLLETFIKKRGAKKQCFVKVEHVRVLVVEGTKLNPSRAGFFVIHDGVELTEDEQEVWFQFQAAAADELRKDGIKVGPMKHTGIGSMNADLYRRSTPVPCDLLGMLRRT